MATVGKRRVETRKDPTLLRVRVVSAAAALITAQKLPVGSNNNKQTTY